MKPMRALALGTLSRVSALTRRANAGCGFAPPSTGKRLLCNARRMGGVQVLQGGPHLLQWGQGGSLFDCQMGLFSIVKVRSN